MNEKEANVAAALNLGKKVWGAGKRMGGFLMGENIPKWVYPATAVAAASPVVGYEFERRNKAMKLRREIAEEKAQMRNARYQAYMQRFSPKFASADERADAAIDRRLGTKFAAGLEDFNQVLTAAKKRSGKAKATRSLDLKPAVTKPGDAGPGARGIAAGAGLGNGGGYGK